ncbi:MAG: hypothetical protein J0H19_25485 [Rhodospirillales bacterium]|nr:hypothetical protein [Rhodospirillales bacterium]MBN8929959.1 hypothetical protein [Rhodospirillales bacterium]
MQYTVCQHHHYGWTKRTHEALDEKSALLADIMQDHPWLDEYQHDFEFRDGRYICVYTGSARHFLVEYSDRVIIGSEIRSGLPMLMLVQSAEGPVSTIIIAGVNVGPAVTLKKMEEALDLLTPCTEGRKSHDR